MKIKQQRLILMISISILIAFFASCATNATASREYLVIQEQGSFAVGGRVITTPGTFDPNNPYAPEGQTLHGDHAYVFYQVPVNSRSLPLVFLHGAGQFSKTWETTPDGREGFQNIFLRRGFPVYLLHQPRRGAAGRSTLPMEINPVADEQMWFSTFRLGNWPEFHPGVQFPRDQESLNQYFRQMTPNTGPHDAQVVSDAVAALFDRIGNGILITHSQGGSSGWFTAMKNDKVKAIVSYEPGLLVFPDEDVPPPIPNSHPMNYDPRIIVPMQEFLKLTKIPIVLYYGDFIPEETTDNPGLETWRVSLQMARVFVETINRHGGDATLVHLPEIGITGNTHFPFSDLNNIAVADQLSKFLNEKGLDR